MSGPRRRVPRSRPVYAIAERSVSIVHATREQKPSRRTIRPEECVVLDIVFLAAAAALFSLVAAYVAACDRM